MAWRAILAGAALVACFRAGARAGDDGKEPPRRRAALERIRSEVERLRGEGRSDEEILRAMRDLASRALGEEGPRPEPGARRGGDEPPEARERPRPERNGRPAPDERGERPRRAELRPERGGSPAPPEGRRPPEPGVEPSIGTPGGFVKKVRDRVHAEVGRLLAEGRSPQEIRSAVLRIKDRARQALERELSKIEEPRGGDPGPPPPPERRPGEGRPRAEERPRNPEARRAEERRPEERPAAPEPRRRREAEL
jgi:hypothetical protein